MDDLKLAVSDFIDTAQVTSERVNKLSEDVSIIQLSYEELHDVVLEMKSDMSDNVVGEVGGSPGNATSGNATSSVASVNAMLSTNSTFIDLGGATLTIDEPIKVPRGNVHIANGYIDASKMPLPHDKGYPPLFDVSNVDVSSWYEIKASCGGRSGTVLKLNNTEEFSQTFDLAEETQCYFETRITDETGIRPGEILLGVRNNMSEYTVFPAPHFQYLANGSHSRQYHARAVRMIDNVKFSNMTLIGPLSKHQYSQSSGIHAQYCSNLDIHNCVIKGNEYANVRLERCFNASVRNCQISNFRTTTDIGHGYGVVCNYGGRNYLINECNFDKLHHAVDSGPTRAEGVVVGIEMRNCKITRTLDPGFNSHGPTMDCITIDNVSYSGLGYRGMWHGLGFSGTNVTVRNCSFSGRSMYPLSIGSAHKHQWYPSEYRAQYIVVDNKLQQSDRRCFSFLNVTVPGAGPVVGCILISRNSADLYPEHGLTLKIYKDTNNVNVSDNHLNSGRNGIECEIGKYAKINNFSLCNNYIGGTGGYPSLRLINESERTPMLDILNSTNKFLRDPELVGARLV